MMLAEEQFPSCKNLIRSECDAYHDIKRSNGARVGSRRPCDVEYLRLLKEDDSIEEQYKAVLTSLLNMNSLLNVDEATNAALKGKNDSEQRQRLKAVTKKRVKDVDSCNGSEEENDHEYELFLQHLKSKGKSYVIEYMKDGSVTKFAYEGAMAADEEGEPQPELRRKLSRACNVAVHDKNPEMMTRAPENKCGPSNQHKYVPQSVKKVRDTEGGVAADEEGEPQPELRRKLSRACNVVVHDKNPKVVTRALENNFGPSNQHKYVPQSIKKVRDTEGATDEEGEPQPKLRRKLSRACNVVVHDKNPKVVTRALENNFGPSNQHKYVPRSVKKVRDTVKVENVGGDYMMPNPKNPNFSQNVRLHGDQNVCMYKSRAVVNETQKYWFSNQMPAVENQQATLLKNTKGLDRGKSRNETNIKKENHVRRYGTYIKKEKHVHRNDKPEGHGSAEIEKISEVYFRKKQSVKNLVRKVKQEPNLPHLMSGKNIKNLASKKPKIEAQKIWIEKYSPSEHRKSMAASCFTAHKKVKEENHKEGKYESDSEVEILDDTLYLKKGIKHPFVFSKKFSDSMMEDGNQQTGSSRVCDEFRKAVVNALRKPYDKEEYKSLQKAVQDLCYFDHYPDLQRKLKKYRYNKKKRLAILRGLFFYLQNVTREGAFKPWKDRACLAVEPPSP